MRFHHAIESQHWEKQWKPIFQKFQNNNTQMKKFHLIHLFSNIYLEKKTLQIYLTLPPFKRTRQIAYVEMMKF